MTQVVTSIGFDSSKEPYWKEFKKIAQREGKPTSEVFMSLIEKYVKEHSENPVPKLDKFVDPTFQAWPTIADRPDSELSFFNDLPTKDVLRFMNHSEEWKLAAQRVLRQRGELR